MIFGVKHIKRDYKFIMEELFQAYQLSDILLKNRFVMAPLTRRRSENEHMAPDEMVAQYYAQRSSAGLIISEGSQISPEGYGSTGSPGCYSEEQIEEVESVISTTRRKLSLVKLAKSARGYNMHDLLPQIKCPVFLVWGKEDRITPPEVAQTFKERLADAHLVYIDKCGHAPIIERPEEFNRHAMNFLESIPYK